MFSGSFIKSSKQIAEDIARRAIITEQSVLRSPACSGEHNYSYTGDGFRIFRGDTDHNVQEDLANDYHQVYQNRMTTLPYHHALTAIHHASSHNSVKKFLSQIQTTERLLASTTRGLNHAQMCNLIQHLPNGNNCKISNDSLIIAVAHTVSRLQVTEISALRIHQRTRMTAFAAMTALLAIRFATQRGNTRYFATCLHHRAIQHVIRRATGTEAVANQVAAPYIYDNKTHLLQHTDPTRHAQLLEEMKARFNTGAPTQDAQRVHLEYKYGPIEFRLAKYYAQKCTELLGEEDNRDNRDNDPTTATKWAHLRTKVQRIRRGEISCLDVHASPDYNNWVYAIHYTYVAAVREFLAAVDRWRSTQPRQPRQQRQQYWHNSKEIRVYASIKTQTTLILREMYRFLIKTHKLISPEFMSVFGLNHRYVNTIIMRTKHLAYSEGDEASALMFGFMMPSMMTPDIHLDIFVKGEIFQEPDLYVKMSDPVFGPIKKKFRDMIPSRHTGTIDRTKLMEKKNYPFRA